MVSPGLNGLMHCSPVIYQNVMSHPSHVMGFKACLSWAVQVDYVSMHMAANTPTGLSPPCHHGLA